MRHEHASVDTAATTRQPVTLNATADELRLLTVTEAANYLSLSRAGLYNLITAGAITSIHIGRSRRIPLIELRRFVTHALNDGV